MPKTTYADDPEDWQVALAKYQISLRYPDLYEYMLEQREKYPKRPKKDRALSKLALVDGRTRRVPAYPLSYVLSGEMEL